MSDTDRRLKDHLNTNQAMRERMCLEILSVQNGYSDVRPRLPKGGPDGGRDVQATYNGDICFGAIGFTNDATDLDDHRKQINKKFKGDLASAIKAQKKDGIERIGFVFFTNVGLTPTIVDDMKKLAYGKGIVHCDIFDRERLRIALDSNRGYAIRFRYLDIPLSDAEQKDFFTTWASEINSVVGPGLRGLDQATKRIQFLLEAQLVLDSLAVVVRLDSSLWGVSKGEVVFQATLSLRVHSDGLIGLVFGGGNVSIVQTPDQLKKSRDKFPRNRQYGYCFSWMLPGTPQYTRYFEGVDKLEHPTNAAGEDKEGHIRTSSSSGVLDIERNTVGFSALSEPFLERFQPSFRALELDGCMILFDCNRDFAEHIEEISVVGNGYEFLRLSKKDWRIEKGKFSRLNLPKEAHQTEDSAEWVTLRPSRASSAFTIDLMASTPRRYDW
ncbi:hypothetical protein [Mesorhizobium sp.]|uniref:hypothetical protein n=1 Tax=Mesorhizobium sp. TaxID=1871066 RepID=UPI000FE7F790|nr:hypothetical protein [Mesorhizobium sp.]RWO46324.1 MAG: hypothetical protein EOS13_26850 [Mesorhizobium sp.]